jgi:hypothetical protein
MQQENHWRTRIAGRSVEDLDTIRFDLRMDVGGTVQ